MSLSDRIPNLVQPAANRYCGGMVDETALAEARDAGVRHVVNLRPDAETPDFNEAEAAAAIGLTYHHLPIAGPDDLDEANVRRFDQIMNQVGDESALVHCASGNRVGALFALRAGWLEGQTPDAALALGRSHGLTKMEPAVAKLLAG